MLHDKIVKQEPCRGCVYCRWTKSVHPAQCPQVAEDLSRVQGVANRDVKLENTLLVSSARPLIKLCDFGYSKVQSPFPCICLPFSRVMGCIPVMCAANSCFPRGFSP